jgi:YD repeat-containing protein
MRVIMAITCLLGAIMSFAQPTKEEIKKFKIKKAVEKRTDDGGTAANHWYYDRKGLDSVKFVYNTAAIYNYAYLQNGKIKTKTLTKQDGKKDVYDYEYQADGSYKETMTDGSFGMKSYEWYDKKGNRIKSQSPDGNTTTFKYDAKGKLLTTISDGKNGGVKINHKNYYNTKGQLVKEERSMDGTKSVTTYEYDAKGVLIKQISKGGWEGEDFETISTCEYNEKGLLKKIIAKSGETITTCEYEYEYY